VIELALQAPDLAHLYRCDSASAIFVPAPRIALA
jgi:hypothetical protein